MTINALALYDELVEVDHLLGAGCPAEEPGSGGGGSDVPEMTESVSGSDIPERMESASLLLLARVVTSHEEASEWDRDLEEESVLLLLLVVSSPCRDTCTHCDDCPWGALL